MSETVYQYPVETGIETTETRGRHASEEHRKLLTMPIEGSFFSPKRREALYELARSIGVKVHILPAEGPNGEEGYRVWKKGHPDVEKANERREAKAARAAMRAAMRAAKRRTVRSVRKQRRRLKRGYAKKTTKTADV